VSESVSKSGRREESHFQSDRSDHGFAAAPEGARRETWGCPHAGLLAEAGGLLILAALAAVAQRQAAFWRDSETLWRRATACDAPNATAHYNLGVTLAEQGRRTEAIAHFEKTLKIQPGSADAHNNLGVVLAAAGRVDAALRHFQIALNIQPDYPDARRNAALALSILKTRKNPTPPRIASQP